ncbi:Membrane protein involved in the export of O-antigen and teichoic acid [Quadrisphaera granulorum]|uniref:O-antigen/teichoic acid export membrane protein n=1 Tax=Quadrisphaera granulorum TaxID=317664 RepID=A0A316A623_9ACTN|nr:oligosaccharide flippase family protein [Quadrisphaera granulorum]PWJ53023.1 O-antigen/teichoic acid export membrane protein [Quadrisphaera granulorum]SZE97188.1 Membrane protein involved in the export of O-antigen and teichoic acid [Quadrisphaera granulorum]
MAAADVEAPAADGRAVDGTTTGLRRSSASMLLGHGGRAAFAGLTFLLVARELEPAGLGAVSAVTAAATLALPFASLGAVHLLVRSAVRTPERLAAGFAGATVVTTVGGLLATVLAALVCALVVPSLPLGVVVALLVADLVGSALLELAAGVQVARGRAMAAAQAQLLFHGLRLAAAVALVLTPVGLTVAGWAGAYLATSLVGAAVAVVVVRIQVGRGASGLAGLADEVRAVLEQWRDGFHFSVGLGAQALYNDLDKLMLTRLGSEAANGAYTVAYRLVDMALVPLRAVLAAAYPRFFAAGAAGGTAGLRSAVGLARSIAPTTVAWCALASVALLAGAGLVPVLLGAEYEPAVGALRWLALLPLLKVAHYLAADALTGAGQQRVRSAWQLGVAVGNGVLNLWLIPAYGLAGAVAASLICDGVLAIALWGVVWGRLRRVPAA